VYPNNNFVNFHGLVGLALVGLQAEMGGVAAIHTVASDERLMTAIQNLDERFFSHSLRGTGPDLTEINAP